MAPTAETMRIAQLMVDQAVKRGDVSGLAGQANLESQAYRNALGDQLTAEDEALLAQIESLNQRAGTGALNPASTEARQKLRERLASVQENRALENRLDKLAPQQQTDFAAPLPLAELDRVLEPQRQQYLRAQTLANDRAFAGQRAAMGAYNPAAIRANQAMAGQAARGLTTTMAATRAQDQGSILDAAMKERARRQAAQFATNQAASGRNIGIEQAVQQQLMQQRSFNAAQQAGSAADSLKFWGWMGDTIGSTGGSVGTSIAGGS